MIRVECNRGEISLGIEGTGIDILSELCVIVDKVCESMAKDNMENAREDKHLMITYVVNTLKRKSEKDFKNDKESDF